MFKKEAALLTPVLISEGRFYISVYVSMIMEGFPPTF